MTKKYFLLALIISAFLWTGCDSDKPDFPPGSIEVSNPNITLEHSNVYELSFNSTYDWSISLSDTTQTGWCDVFPLTGKGGDARVTIKASANQSYNDRSVFLTLKSDNIEKTIEVYQEFGCGVSDIYIPDKAFRNYCLEYFDTDGNGLISATEVNKIVKLRIDSYVSGSIKSLQGIEYFRSLRDLTLSNSYYNLEELDLRMNKNLEKLIISSSNLSALDLSNNTELKELEGRFYFNTLDLSKNTKLEKLTCYYGSLTSIDISNNPNLKTFACTDNNIKKLDLSNSTALETIDCTYNNMTELIIGDQQNLTTLNCRYNQLSTLNIGNCPKLEYLNCSDNRLTSLDVSKCTGLSELNCTYNRLSVLDLINNLLIKYIYSYSYYSDSTLSEIKLNAEVKDNIIYISKNYDTQVTYTLRFVVPQ